MQEIYCSIDDEQVEEIKINRQKIEDKKEIFRNKITIKTNKIANKK